MAEKLTSALLLRPTRAAWTSLRDKKGDVEVVEQADAPIELPPDAGLESPDMAAQIKARCSGVKGIVTLVLPSSTTLIRVVELPSTDPEEIRSMAELQMDKFAPFASDQMCIGHEVLAQGEDKSRVLVAAAPRGTVDALGTAFLQAGILPQRIDVEIMGWWWLLKSKGRIAQSGRQIHLVIDDGNTGLMIVQDGSPLLLRSLGALRLDPQEAAGEIAEEISYTLTTLETEWGGGHVDAVHVWCDDNVNGDLLAALNTACGFHVAAEQLKTLAPLSEGLARRIHEQHGATLDMAPAEWKATALSREAKKKMVILATTLMAFWLMAIGGLFAYSRHEQTATYQFKLSLQRLDKKAGEVRDLQKQVQSLERYADRSFSALECLREICVLMPPGPELNSFNYEKYNQVSLRGLADSDGPILDFFRQLQTTKFFPKVAPGQITTAPPRNNRPQSQFKATITLPEEKKPDEKKPGEKRT